MASKNSELTAAARGHMGRMLDDLVGSGWTLEQVPASAHIPRNGMRLHLKSNGGQEIRLRIFGFKVSTSGRNKPHERRVEITSTYQSGVERLHGYRDVVIGVDTALDRYVGVDPRRLQIGGSTHSASSFFDLEGLASPDGGLLINPRRAVAPIFPDGVEQHAFFDGAKLAEYLFNAEEIHEGLYNGRGAFSGRTPRKLRPRPNSWTETGTDFVLAANGYKRDRPSLGDLEAIERSDFTLLKKKLSPADLRALQAICEEVGALGEQYVLKKERARLKKAGKVTAARNVTRVSLRSVSEGYDILSFEDDGKTERYIEVKTTVGKRMVVDISIGEWRAAEKHKHQFLIARVVDARGTPKVQFVRDPVALEDAGHVKKMAGSWRVDLSKF